MPSMPSFSELLQRTSLVFVNSHYLLDTARPLAHKVKQIGGVAVPEPKELNNVGDLGTATLKLILFSAHKIKIQQ